MEYTDCLVVGGGPAGLTAAIYLARYHLSVTVVDAGNSRAALIPLTRNHAGFPDGISGPDLLARMRDQAARYGAVLRQGQVESIGRQAEDFLAVTDWSTIKARTILFASGVVNRRPPMMSDTDHDRALASGRLRYCPVCDGYEVTDRRVAVLGTGEHGCAEALFLRGYTGDITLFAPEGGHDLSGAQKARLGEADIVIAGICRTIRQVEDGIVIGTDDESRRFACLYPALGSDTRSEIAAQLGAKLSKDGCLLVDGHQRTSVSGVYAAGDVVLGLDQISHAMGQGGVASTTIRNDLDRRKPIRR